MHAAVVKRLCSILLQSEKCSDKSDEDVVGMPETTSIKIARGVAKVASKLLPFIAKTGVMPDDAAMAFTEAGKAIENQEKMDKNASLSDRARVGGKFLQLFIILLCILHIKSVHVLQTSVNSRLKGHANQGFIASYIHLCFT